MNFTLKTVLRLVLGMTFLVAGGMKMSDPLGFFSDLLSYRVPFPEVFLRVEAAGLPWLEVLVGLGLIFDFWPETIRPVACVLLLIFVLILGQAIVRGLDVNCGCFGAGSGWFERLDVALARATILFAASIYVAAAPSIPGPSAPPQGGHGPRDD